MKTFTVEGVNWTEDYRVDPTLFDSYEDMAFEAMTQALEEYMTFPSDPIVWHSSCEHAKNKVERWGDGHERDNEELLKLGWTTLAYEKGGRNKPDKTIAALTELVLRNAGHHKQAEEVRVLWEQEKIKKGIK